ncbi:MAG: PLDc N-terminal domain-containing protein [Flavobacterium sp.]|nr:PLDc N-terminal domain-containing protein [Flavobacterium sp.]
MDLLINLLPLLITIYSIFICIFIFVKILRKVTFSSSDKLLWALIILCVPILGVTAYILLTKK